AKVVVTQLVEIIAPDIDVEVLAPIVLHPLVDDAAARHDLLDAVGAVAERRLERGHADVALAALLIGALPPVLRQHGELADDLRQLAVAGALKSEFDLVIAEFFGLNDVPIGGAGLRIELLEGFE